MCLDVNVPSICASPSQYLFWDDLHPSARGHEILARSFAQAAVPEPATFIVVSAGLIAIGLRGRADMSRGRQ
jgi:outer membrane lipase/esterase